MKAGDAANINNEDWASDNFSPVELIPGSDKLSSEALSLRKKKKRRVPLTRVVKEGMDKDGNPVEII